MLTKYGNNIDLESMPSTFNHMCVGVGVARVGEVKGCAQLGSKPFE